MPPLPCVCVRPRVLPRPPVSLQQITSKYAARFFEPETGQVTKSGGCDGVASNNPTDGGLEGVVFRMDEIADQESQDPELPETKKRRPTALLSNRPLELLFGFPFGLMFRFPFGLPFQRLLGQSLNGGRNDEKKGGNAPVIQERKREWENGCLVAVCNVGLFLRPGKQTRTELR